MATRMPGFIHLLTGAKTVTPGESGRSRGEAARGLRLGASSSRLCVDAKEPARKGLTCAEERRRGGAVDRVWDRVDERAGQAQAVGEAAVLAVGDEGGVARLRVARSSLRWRP